MPLIKKVINYLVSVSLGSHLGFGIYDATSHKEYSQLKYCSVEFSTLASAVMASLFLKKRREYFESQLDNFPRGTAINGNRQRTDITRRL